MTGGADNYVIRSGAAAVERLELLARLFRPTTLDWLDRLGALGPGRFLDVGCGIGDVAGLAAEHGADAVGIDVNPEVIEAARARARRTGSSARFEAASLDDLGSRPELSGVDVVFARCLASHLPDPGDGIAAMVAALRPGGRIVVEDVHVSGVWASPPCAALERHLDLYVAAARGVGASPDVGAHLATHLSAAGVVGIDLDVVQPLLRRPEDLRIHASTMEAIAGPVVDQGLATTEEVEGIVADLDTWADEPGVVATLPRIVQVTGTAP